MHSGSRCSLILARDLAILQVQFFWCRVQAFFGVALERQFLYGDRAHANQPASAPVTSANSPADQNGPAHVYYYDVKVT